MKRGWNLPIWIGTLVIVVAAVTFVPLVERAPDLATPPWITLAAFAAGLALIAVGIARAFRDPARHRGKVFGPILGVLGLAMTGLFVFGTFYFVRQIPSSPDAPKVGDRAPEFTLADQGGHQVSLADLLGGRDGGHGHGAVLIFYRGYW